jgi:hypothetical protein
MALRLERLGNGRDLFALPHELGLMKIIDQFMAASDSAKVLVGPTPTRPTHATGFLATHDVAGRGGIELVGRRRPWCQMQLD